MCGHPPSVIGHDGILTVSSHLDHGPVAADIVSAHWPIVIRPFGRGSANDRGSGRTFLVSPYCAWA